MCEREPCDRQWSKILRSWVYTLALSFMISYVGRGSCVFFHCSFSWFVVLCAVLCCANMYCSDHDRPRRVRLHSAIDFKRNHWCVSYTSHAHAHTQSIVHLHAQFILPVWFLRRPLLLLVTVTVFVVVGVVLRKRRSRKLSSAHNELWAFWQIRNFGCNSGHVRKRKR